MATLTRGCIWRLACTLALSHFFLSAAVHTTLLRTYFSALTHHTNTHTHTWDACAHTHTDTCRSEVLLGQAHVYLDSLYHLLDIALHTPIFDYKGKVQGELSVR